MLCAKSTFFPLLVNRTREARALCGFQHLKGITCFVFCFLQADNYRSRKQREFFNTLAGFFPGTLKNAPCSHNEIMVKFREESGGIGRFCRLEFQRMANWPSFAQKIETGRIIRNRRPRAIHTVSIKSRNWASWPAVGIRACKIGQSH